MGYDDQLDGIVWPAPRCESATSKAASFGLELERMSDSQRALASFVAEMNSPSPSLMSLVFGDEEVLTA